MTGERHPRGLLDTNIMILRRWIDPGELPAEVAVTAITLAELSAGPHQVRRADEQDEYAEHAERARRLDVLQRAESEFAAGSREIPSWCNLRRFLSNAAGTACCRAIGRNMP
jgi:predicted nucleic acid-binding protein